MLLRAAGMGLFRSGNDRYYKKIISGVKAVLARHSIFVIIAVGAWAFMDYVEPSGRNPFREWLSGLPQEAQARIDTQILQMEGMEKWSEKWASNYKGVEGIIELRIRFKGVQYRPLGMYSKTQRMTFVVLCGAIEKGGKIPKRDLETAERRRKDLLKEPHRVRRHQF